MIERGTRIGDAVLEERLADGASASVWKARRAGKPVVVKLLHPAVANVPDWAIRVTREAEALAAIQSPHVVKVLTSGTADDGTPYVVLEYLEGPTLRETLDREGPMSAPAAWAIVRALALALADAHDAGVVHRDVKPDNVILSAGVPKLVDFGLAKPLEDDAVLRRLTATGAPMGTPAYMAPEQWWNDGVGAAADQYGLGVLAFELLTGRLPFPASSYPELMQAHLSAPPPTLAGADVVASSEVETWIGRLLAKKPADRFPSLREAVAQGDAAFGGPAPTPNRDPSWAALLGGPLLLFAWGYPGARDPRELAHLTGASIFGVLLAYLGGAVWMRRRGSLFAAFLPGLAGTFGTYTGWQQVLTSVAAMPAGQSFESFHTGMYEANGNRFVGFALAACLFFATALYRRRVDARGRVTALVLGTLAASAAALTRAGAELDRLWETDLLRAERTDALFGAGRVLLWTEALVTLSLVAVTVLATARWRDTRARRTVRVSGAAALALAWAVVDASMLLRVQTQKGDLYAALAPEFTLLSRLDPPPCSPADRLPPPPVAPTLKIARDRLALDDQPVGLLSAFEEGGLDEVLRSDLSHRLARDGNASPTLSLMVDRAVALTAVTRSATLGNRR